MKQKVHDESNNVGVLKWADMLFYLRASGSLMFPIFYVLFKLGVHGLIVFYEVNLAAFANQAVARQTR